MIEIKNIHKKFDDYTIFSDFSYTFVDGQSYALIGASGSGKTTLLNILGKLENVDSGMVLIDGKPLTKIKEKDYFKSYISYIFQNHGLIENRTVKENLELAFIGKKIDVTEKVEHITQALKAVNLNVDVNRKIFSLSGGEAQRVAVAKAMLKDSPIILADEPTASLDEKNTEEVIALILGLKKENKIIIIATHNPNVYNRLDNIITIEKREPNEFKS